MLRLLITFGLLLLVSFSASTREFTKPPSIELRSEISFVAETVLTNKSFNKEKKRWALTFKLVNDIHNTSENQIKVMVNQDLANTLALNESYVIAYQNHRKAKVDGVKRYLPLQDGPTLLSVQGAEPAVFKNHESIIRQLNTSPDLAQSNPQKLIKNIIDGITIEDPKIRTFFVRELINWNGLYTELNHTQKQQLLTTFLDPNTPTESLLAFVENRPDLHQALDIDKMIEKVSQILIHMPTTQDNQSAVATFVHEALQFLNNHQVRDWDLNHRWLRSDNPSITEVALSQLHIINPQKAQLAVKKRLLETNISDTSRRVLKRYLKKYSH